MLIHSLNPFKHNFLLTSSPLHPALLLSGRNQSQAVASQPDGEFRLPSERNVNQPAPRAAKSAALLQNASGAFAGGVNPKPTCLASQARLRLEHLPVFIFYFFCPSSFSRVMNLVLFSHCVVSVEAADGGRLLSPPGARWATRPLGCRVSFVLFGAVRSFRAAGLR